MIAKHIEKDTKLFGLLADEASSLKKARIVSEYFVELGIDAAYIPMNIRHDDIYFTIHGLKESKIEAVNLGSEYTKSAFEQMDIISDEASLCGFVDTIKIENGKLLGSITIGEAFANILTQINAKKITILGSGSLARSIILHLKQTNVKEVVLLHERLESAMSLFESMQDQLEGLEVDFDRYEKDIAYSANTDALINTSSLGRVASDDFIKFSSYPTYLMDSVNPSRNSKSYFAAIASDKSRYLGGDDLSLEMIKIDSKNWF